MKKLFFLLILFLFIPKVNAEDTFGEVEFWQENIKQNTDLLEVYNFTGTTAYSNKSFSQIGGYIQESYYPAYSVLSASAYTNGLGFLYHVNTRLDPDYIYSLATYICSNTTATPSAVLTTGPNTSTAISTTMKYHQTSMFSLDPYIVNNYIDEYSTKCWQYTSVFVPQTAGDYALLRLRSNTNTSFNWTFMGYSLEPLGLYSNSVKTIVEDALDNSGLATASSIEEVDQGIADMKSQLAQDADDINNSINGTTDAVDNLNDSITSSDVEDTSGSFNEFESYLPENGVITDLITLPISLFQNVLSSINGTCTQYNLGSLMGTDLIFPCINISDYIGSTLWNVIDVLFSGLFVLTIGKKMIKVFNNFSSMEEGDVLD